VPGAACLLAWLMFALAGMQRHPALAAQDAYAATGYRLAPDSPAALRAGGGTRDRRRGLEQAAGQRAKHLVKVRACCGMVRGPAVCKCGVMADEPQLTAREPDVFKCICMVDESQSIGRVLALHREAVVQCRAAGAC
jgi:hypothetical protein